MVDTLLSSTSTSTLTKSSSSSVFFLPKLAAFLHSLKFQGLDRSGSLDYIAIIFKVPQVEGGSFISLKIRWSQKLLYHDGKFCLTVPFNFPAYVNPVGNKIMKGEKISLSVNMGAEAEVLCQTISHPLKVVRRQRGRLSFSYEARVAAWSKRCSASI